VGDDWNDADRLLKAGRVLEMMPLKAAQKPNRCPPVCP
jgi:hypothetical protein